jgi:hypothetical protein
MVDMDSRMFFLLTDRGALLITWSLMIVPMVEVK